MKKAALFTSVIIIFIGIYIYKTIREADPLLKDPMISEESLIELVKTISVKSASSFIINGDAAAGMKITYANSGNIKMTEMMEAICSKYGLECRVRPFEPGRKRIVIGNEKNGRKYLVVKGNVSVISEGDNRDKEK